MDQESHNEIAKIAAADERIKLARHVLIELGYFTPEQVGDDVAPRITEMFSALTRNSITVLEQARRALSHAAQTCRYHGADFERLGMWNGEPRCESCRQPWRVTQALTAISRYMFLDRLWEQGGSNRPGRARSNPDERGLTRRSTSPPKPRPGRGIGFKSPQSPHHSISIDAGQARSMTGPRSSWEQGGSKRLRSGSETIREGLRIRPLRKV